MMLCPRYQRAAPHGMPLLPWCMVVSSLVSSWWTSSIFKDSALQDWNWFLASLMFITRLSSPGMPILFSLLIIHRGVTVAMDPSIVFDACPRSSVCTVVSRLCTSFLHPVCVLIWCLFGLYIMVTFLSFYSYLLMKFKSESWYIIVILFLLSLPKVFS